MQRQIDEDRTLCWQLFHLDPGLFTLSLRRAWSPLNIDLSPHADLPSIVLPSCHISSPR